MFLELLFARFARDVLAVQLLQFLKEFIVVLFRVGRPVSMRLGLEADGVGPVVVVIGSTQTLEHQLGEVIFGQLLERPERRRFRFRS